MCFRIRLYYIRIRFLYLLFIRYIKLEEPKIFIIDDNKYNSQDINYLMKIL